jgi:hypothetical protein
MEDVSMESEGKAVGGRVSIGVHGARISWKNILE